VYDGWVYGDAVFIVEPLFWTVAIPPLWFAAQARVTRIALATVLIAGLTLCWVLALRSAVAERLVPLPSAVAVTLVAGCATFAAWKASPLIRIALGVAGSWALAAIFFAATGAAAAEVRRSPHLAATAIDDVVITPMPVNPLCATVLVVGSQGADYVIERATVATMPGWFAAERCPTAFEGNPTAPLSPVVAPGDPVAWKDEFRAPLREIVDLAQQNCQVAAFLRFARAPYWVRTSRDELIVGDLRFDRAPGLDFSDVRLDARPTVCPKAVPPWLPPRAHLFDPRR